MVEYYYNANVLVLQDQDHNALRITLDETGACLVIPACPWMTLCQWGFLIVSEGQARQLIHQTGYSLDYYLEELKR